MINHLFLLRKSKFLEGIVALTLLPSSIAALMEARSAFANVYGADEARAATSSSKESADEVERMPAFVLEDLAGKKFNSEQLKGKVVLIDFWATWCKPCVEEISLLNSLRKKYSPRGLVVLGITLDSGDRQSIQPHVKSHRIQYPILVGNEEVRAEYGGIPVFPNNFLVARDGRLVKNYRGAFPDKRADLEREIEKLLQEKFGP